MKLRPLGNRIIVKPAKKDEVNKSGLYIPGANEGAPEQGEVIAIGIGSCVIRCGDKIIFNKYSPDKIKIGEEEYLILSESDVMGVLED